MCGQDLILDFNFRKDRQPYFYYNLMHFMYEAMNPKHQSLFLNISEEIFYHLKESLHGYRKDFLLYKLFDFPTLQDAKKQFND